MADGPSPPAKSALRLRPWRVVLVLILLPLLALSFRYELGMAGLDTVSIALADRVEWAGVWATGFAERLLTSPLKLALVLLILVAAVFAVLQAIALRDDRAPAKTSVMRLLSGRPYRVPDGGEYAKQMRDWGSIAMLSPLRAGLSLFPMLGFLGTVVGLSLALRDLPAAVEDNALLGPVLDSLYVAFDTTLLGLFGAIICLIALRLIEDHIDITGRGGG